MRHFPTTIGFLLFLFTLFGVASPGAAKLRVITTTSDLASITRAVGGEHVEVTSIAKGREDPHFIEARPSFMLLAHQADLFIRIGMALETTWEPAILQGARNAGIQLGNSGHLDASAGVEPLQLPTTSVDRSMGDVHPFGNPHYWLDPWNGRLMAATIAERLEVLDPGNGPEYQKGLESFRMQLDRSMFGEVLTSELDRDELWRQQRAGTLHAWLQEQGRHGDLAGWAGRLEPHRGAKIVTFHRSFPYFANRFGLDVVEELEPKPGIPPSPNHLVEVIRTMHQQQAGVILMEPFYSTKPAELVAAKVGAVVVKVANSVGGDEESVDYVALLDRLVNQVADALDREGV